MFITRRSRDCYALEYETDREQTKACTNNLVLTREGAEERTRVHVFFPVRATARQPLTRARLETTNIPVMRVSFYDFRGNVDRHFGRGGATPLAVVDGSHALHTPRSVSWSVKSETYTHTAAVV